MKIVVVSAGLGQPSSTQMLGERLDLFRENGDLNFARTGVTLVTLELLPNGCFIDLAHSLLSGPCSACFFFC